MFCTKKCPREECPYTTEGQEFRQRMEYCPYADMYFDEEEQEKYLRNRKFRKLKGLDDPGFRRTMHDWRRNIDNKNKRGNQTPGKTKVLQCQASFLKRYLAKRSRSYKHRAYRMWHDIFAKR